MFVNNENEQMFVCGLEGRVIRRDEGGNEVCMAPSGAVTF